MISVKDKDNVMSERLTRYTKEVLQWMLRRMSRSEVVECLKFALRILNVTTDK